MLWKKGKKKKKKKKNALDYYFRPKFYQIEQIGSRAKFFL